MFLNMFLLLILRLEKCVSHNYVQTNDSYIELLIPNNYPWNHLTACKQMIDIEENYLCSIGILEIILLWTKTWEISNRIIS